jgi:hypothetical protein
MQTLSAYAAYAPQLSYHCPPNVPIDSNNNSFSMSSHLPPAVISLLSKTLHATLDTIDTCSRTFDMGSPIPHSLLPALSNTQQSHHRPIPNVVLPKQCLPLPSLPVVPPTLLHEKLTIVSSGIGYEPMTGYPEPTKSNTQPAHEQPIRKVNIGKGTRYELMTGFPPPLEFSGNQAVRSFLEQMFPCPYGGWIRKRSLSLWRVD